MEEVKKLSDGAVVKCCGECLHCVNEPIAFVPYCKIINDEDGHVEVNPDTIHPKCPLQTVEVIESKKNKSFNSRYKFNKDYEQIAYVCQQLADEYRFNITGLSEIRLKDIEQILIVRKGEK